MSCDFNAMSEIRTCRCEYFFFVKTVPSYMGLQKDACEHAPRKFHEIFRVQFVFLGTFTKFNCLTTHAQKSSKKEAGSKKDYTVAWWSEFGSIKNT